ncbi:hypothetical protein [Pararhodobacter sp. SW119]|uniref:hypothetical protein n=1 Tax=Pararhodobacter sp. SW119 TaxID=2780075 RepID=UPI001AE08525|nr:hypothetical protein [Pararhodobacter sp. SW119]
MPYTDPLKRLLRKGSFPLKADSSLPLWEELIKSLETQAATATAEAKALQQGLDYGIFGDTVTVNGISFNPGLDDLGMFLGAMHAELMRDFDIYNRRGDTRIHDFARRIRDIAIKHNILAASDVTLQPVSPDHGMGTGLVTTGELNFIPDPNLCDKGGFGSQPDQKLIGIAAPQWELLKKRRYVKQTTGAIGRASHYVLAHLLNHQVNGSGKKVANVVAFASDGNKQMAKQVEGILKEAVHRGLTVNYAVSAVGKVGMTPGRSAALQACSTQTQKAIIEIEQHLPEELVISLSVRQADGTYVSIISQQRISNFVPETVPVI